MQLAGEGYVNNEGWEGCQRELVKSILDYLTADPCGPWHPTFALAQLKNLGFFIQITCWVP